MKELKSEVFEDIEEMDAEVKHAKADTEQLQKELELVKQAKAGSEQLMVLKKELGHVKSRVLQQSRGAKLTPVAGSDSADSAESFGIQ